MLAPGEHALEPGTLSVRVGDHDLLAPDVSGAAVPSMPGAEIALPAARCRSYLTRGLAAFGQREIVFVLPAREGRVDPALEQDVLALFRVILPYARDGHIVDAGDVTAFARNALFGVPRCGIAYLEPVGGPGPEVPVDALVALFLRPEEVSAAGKANAYRAAAWIAHAYRLFPYPQFSDPMRPAAVPPDLPESLLADAPLLRSTTYARAFLADETLTLRLDPAFLDGLDSAFAHAATHPYLALLTGHVPQADARVVWLEQGDALPLIGPAGSTASLLEGGFVGFLGQRPADEASIVEDGFAVQLRSESWAAMQDAVRSRRTLQIAMGGDDDRFIRQFRIGYGLA